MKILLITLTTIIISIAITTTSTAQYISTTIGNNVSPDIEIMTKNALTYLKKSQQKNGSWGSSYGSEPGVVGLAVLAFLSHGDDPNYGTYSTSIKRGINFILKQQNKTTGYIGNSMYNHGFATLALAEAYGALNDDRIGPALEKAVKLLLQSQKNNPHNAWRYIPTSTSADTTISGACLVALFAARNAGVEIPDDAFKKALKYYKKCQSDDGGFGYTNPGGSNAPRTAIGTLVFALDKKKEKVFKNAYQYLATAGTTCDYYYFYYLYYASQAFFHSSNKGWKKWNSSNIKTLKATQSSTGSWQGSNGETFSTAAAVLSLALNYRFLPIYER